jgi:uncharacterized membrane protein
MRNLTLDHCVEWGTALLIAIAGVIAAIAGKTLIDMQTGLGLWVFFVPLATVLFVTLLEMLDHRRSQDKQKILPPGKINR